MNETQLYNVGRAMGLSLDTSERVEILEEIVLLLYDVIEGNAIGKEKVRLYNLIKKLKGTKK